FGCVEQTADIGLRCRTADVDPGHVQRIGSGERAWVAELNREERFLRGNREFVDVRDSQTEVGCGEPRYLRAVTESVDIGDVPGSGRVLRRRNRESDLERIVRPSTSRNRHGDVHDTGRRNGSGVVNDPLSAAFDRYGGEDSADVDLSGVNDDVSLDLSVDRGVLHIDR